MAEFRHPGVYVEETGSRAIAPAPTAVAAFVGHTMLGPVGRPVAVTSFTEFAQAFGGLADSSELSYAVLQYFRNSGERALIVRVAESDTGLPGIEDLIEALRCLEREAAFTLLVVPDCTRPGQPLGTASAFPPEEMNRLWQAAVELCFATRAFLIVDPPMELRDIAAARAWLDGLPVVHRDFAATYLPWLAVADPLHGSQRPCAPGGSIAGLIARIDRQSGCWKAPAGPQATLSNVKALAADYTDAHATAIGPLGLNVVRRIAGPEIVCWGARTLLAAGDWRYVPTRRLASHIERSVEAGTGWAAFEPAGEPLLRVLEKETRGFLHRLFASGAFVGQKAEEAYYVRCDRQTMRPGDADEGIAMVEIGFAPIRPAEFVVVRIGVRTQPPSA